MAAHTPEAVHAEWMKAFNNGNVEEMIALYEPDSAVVSEPGEAPPCEMDLRQPRTLVYPGAST